MADDEFQEVGEDPPNGWSTTLYGSSLILLTTFRKNHRS